MKNIALFLSILFAHAVFAQTADEPKDFLTKEFHKERRQKLREKLPPNSVAVFFANAVRNRSNDVDYVYHQDPNFFYFTGYKEPNSVLLIFKDKQTANNGKQYDEIIFVQPRNERAEMWTGRRLGDSGVKARLGLENAFNNKEFKKYNVDFSKFDQILFIDFENDVRNEPYDSADLYDLIDQFKAKVNYPSTKSGLALNREPQKNNLNTTGLVDIMGSLRSIKAKEELDLIKKAVKISCAGQVEVMKAMKPGMSEREIQGIHEYVFKKYQAEDLGYPSIVGAGHNGCILHYIDNYKPNITTKELILMDLGAEYRGYTADITRTIPVSGKFSPEQKQIYELVLKAQEEAMKTCKPGTSFAELTAITRTVINKGLKDLGIIKSETEQHTYYPHGCCHHIGLDVHDWGPYDKLQENMVITIEPGIYIPENAPCDKKWWSIAVRIEDDFLITKDGNEHISASAPRKVEEIEATMKLPSPLDDFILPDLEKGK
ncbi:aminopeptidase P N-terminal domain-containing protein [Chryseosolibacter indicus]|uniref:Xaa-Pro aminopeptidase n=1 Tax=Chryseosolibacter indicus TaxID=2782351 RepID=A0ABS5VSD4_9BACT|nr:aminopeptidase P N-terminal domain-containing protein [Chryseosolibacter indicus]MBT1702916.1 aminopeptidase P N-terminal domain-containing protein [Chryseosolibacter indicus]